MKLHYNVKRPPLDASYSLAAIFPNREDGSMYDRANFEFRRLRKTFNWVYDSLLLYRRDDL